jgi:hypothetical protein
VVDDYDDRAAGYGPERRVAAASAYRGERSAVAAAAAPGVAYAKDDAGAPPPWQAAARPARQPVDRRATGEAYDAGGRYEPY